MKYSDDLGKYLYIHIEHKKCALCNTPADIHHTKAIGMGRDRDTIVHEGMSAIALCRLHHGEAHNTGWDTFSKRYHVEGIKLDRYLCKKIGVKAA